MLIVTIHDVAPPHLDAVRALRDAAHAWGVTSATLLAIPDHHGRAPLERCPATVRWLSAAAAAGDEIALHGLTHRQASPAPRLLDRARARLLTDGEAEMLSASAPSAFRLAGARAELEDLLGTPVRGFVAPAWLEPPRFAATLHAAGFAWHETALRLRYVAPAVRGTCGTWHLTPAIGFATRSSWRELASRVWARALALRAPARVALHPSDLRSPRVMALAERIVRALTARHPAVTTSSALGLR
jgi:predicted deacetylase